MSLNAIGSLVVIKRRIQNRISTDWIGSVGVFLCSFIVGGDHMTMITIMEAIAIIGAAGGGIAILSYLVGLNQGRKTNTL